MIEKSINYHEYAIEYDTWNYEMMRRCRVGIAWQSRFYQFHQAKIHIKPGTGQGSSGLKTTGATGLDGGGIC